MGNKLIELSKPVAYSLRFRNMNGEPDKTINANTTFSTLEKAKAYGLGTRYVTQDDGKIVSVRDPAQDPIVEPLYSQEYVSALLAELEAKDEALRAIAFHVSAGGYNADSVDAEVFKQKIIDGINGISDVLVKRLAELESANKSQDDHINQQQDRIDSLEKKNGDLGRSLGAAEKRLATPVRLPTAMFCPEEYIGSLLWSETEAYNKAISKCAEALRAAGFKVEGG